MMRFAVTLAACLCVIGCATLPSDLRPDAVTSPRYAFWRPAPVAGAIEPAVAVENAVAADWREIEPDNLLVMELKDGGRVVIELAPDFAPVHVANVRTFARADWWNDAAVSRVQDNYVAQWGNGEADVPLPRGVVKAPPAEYHRTLGGLQIRPLGFPDSYAPVVGHAGSWPTAYDPELGQVWLTHCYGMVGVGRELAPDTGTGGELYVVIGHAPRHLDRNIALVGRVIDGIASLSARARGTEALGFYKDPSQHIAIARVSLASEMLPHDRPAYEVLRSDSVAFSHYVTGRANRGGDFFIRPAGGVDICNVQVPVRRKVEGRR